MSDLIEQSAVCFSLKGPFEGSAAANPPALLGELLSMETHFRNNDGVNGMDTIRLVLEETLSADQFSALKAILESHGVKAEAATGSSGLGTLALDPATLIASGANVLAALITAFFAYRANQSRGTVVVVGKSGRRLEIPKWVSEDELERYLDLARSLDVESVIVKKE
jgi:hypothetical protein